jgi:L-ascorbate metabolism protein UlaG (beta-lactamase superfamily)
MKIKFYGHSAFMITTDTGVRIITDPYQSGAFGGALLYDRITEEADIVLASHDHEDHNYTKDIKGKFIHIETAGVHDVKGLKIRAIACHHDALKGKERGNNLIFVIDTDEFTIVHAGDLGHTLEKEVVKEIGNVDILLIPVGGFYTIDAREAAKVMTDLKPAITIPMHFKTDKCNFPISDVEEFIKGKKGVKRVKTSEIDIKKKLLSKEHEIIVLEPAL